MNANSQIAHLLNQAKASGVVDKHLSDVINDYFTNDVEEDGKSLDLLNIKFPKYRSAPMSR
jgi:hypothetical protein